jgi:transposase-like protein
MGRPKGGKNRYWSKEEKLRIVKKILDESKSSYEVAKEENISSGMLRLWTRKYLEGGSEALVNKKKPGNPLSKYLNKKNLTREEELEYENMKLKIELERLKKGYKVKGDGQRKQYITIRKKNSK